MKNPPLSKGPSKTRLKALELGRRAEDFAALWITNQPGCRILGRNLRFRNSELDVAFERNRGPGAATEIVFVEIRARALGAFVSPEDFLGPAKYRRFILAAGQCLAGWGRGGFEEVRLELWVLTDLGGAAGFSMCQLSLF